MRIMVDDVLVFELTDIQKNVLKHGISSNIFEDDIKRRMKYKVMHTYRQCYRLLREEWEPKLIALGHETIPTDPDTFAELVFAEPTYMDRAAKDAAAQIPILVVIHSLETDTVP